MATVYPTAAGTWSTRTWNDDATNLAYGPGTPQAADIVLANGFAITIDANITVASIKTVAGVTAAAGGSFSTSGAVTVTADTYAGTTSCLTLNNGATQIGDSYGSTTNAFTFATNIPAGNHAVQIGNATAGTAGNSTDGTRLASGVMVGNASSGSGAVGAAGCRISGGVMIGNATGGTTATSAVVITGGIFEGNCTGGTIANSHGVNMTGGIALIDTATGTIASSNGVTATGGIIRIKTESGAHAKNIGALVDTTETYLDFLDYVGPQISLPATPLAAIGRLEIKNLVDISGNDLEVEFRKHAGIALTPITPANSAVAGWFKFPEDLSVSINTLLFCGTFRSNFSTNGSLWVYVNNMAAATTLTYRCNGVTLVSAITSTNFLGNWQHVAANNEAGAITVYLNGVSQGSWGTIANPDIRGIGIDSEGASGRSNADGAGVAVWDRILTGEEITWLANPANRPGPSSPTPSEIATAIWTRAGRTLTS